MHALLCAKGASVFFFSPSLLTAQISNTQTELEKLAEQNPELKDAYLAKQRRLKVSSLISRVPNELKCCVFWNIAEVLPSISTKPD